MALATGMVIGLGGTGAQVISRLNTFVEAERATAESAQGGAKSELEFLAIDAFPIDIQPEEVRASGLRPEQYLNLVPTAGFNPEDVLKAKRPLDPYLASWWSDDYMPQAGQTVLGMKVNRRLGRLAYYNEKALLTDRLQSTLGEAMRIHRENHAEGEGVLAGDLPVYVVASCVGGTGSSGFLEVVHSLYVAAKMNADVSIKIYAFIYLPGVYRNRILAGPESGMMVRQHNANAFAFFRELDHYMNRTGEFFEDFDRNSAGRRVSDSETNQRLIHQTFLMDGVIGGVGSVASQEDVYAVTAEGLYQLIMTRTGRDFLGPQGTNIEEVFSGVDKFGKSLAYCSMGVGTLLFPGDTYRAYLSRRYQDNLIRTVLVPGSTGLLPTQTGEGEQQTQIDPKAVQEQLQRTARAERGALADTLQKNLDELLASVVKGVALPDAARGMQTLGSAAPGTLQTKPELATAGKIITQVQTYAGNGALASDLRRTYGEAVETLTGTLDDAILKPLYQSGEPLPFLGRTLRKTSKRIGEKVKNLSQERAEISARTTLVFDANGGTGSELQDKLDALRRLEEPGWFKRVSGSADRDKKLAAVALGNAIQIYAEGILREAAKQAQFELAERIVERLTLWAERADQAETNLIDRAKELRRLWEEDELVGKDVGPADSQLLLPKDTLPEVEDSRLAVKVWEETEADFAQDYLGPDGTDRVAALYRAVDDEIPGGILMLGSSDSKIRAEAGSRLMEVLAELAGESALLDPKRNPRLPVDLAAAADDEETLGNALKGLTTLARGVYWSFDPNRAIRQSLGGVEASNALYTATGRAKEMLAPLLEGTVNLFEGPDPERATAVVTQYAAPAHSLTEVPTWERDYRQVNEDLRLEPKKTWKPPHVSARFQTDLDPFVPEYFDWGQVVEQFGRGLMVERLIDHPQVQALLPPAVRRDEWWPMDTSDWPLSPIRGTRYRFDERDGQFKIDGRPVALGLSPGAVVKQLGDRQELARSIDSFWERIRDRVPPEDQIKAAGQLQGGVLKHWLEEAEKVGDRDSLSVLDGLDNFLGSLRKNLQMKIDAGGNTW